jgi:hypothetical protein
VLNKATYGDDDSLNTFFKKNCDEDGKSNFYLVKFIVSFNPFERKTEYHIIYSTDPKMKAGQHMRGNGGK